MAYSSVSSGITSDGIVLEGQHSMGVLSGGTANNTTVNAGGVLGVWEGGLAQNTTVNFNGSMRISMGGTATQIKENGGYVSVIEGASVTFLPNTFSGLAMSGFATATIHSGTTAFETNITFAASLCVLHGGIANRTAVFSSGSLIVSSGGVATDTNVLNCGSVTVSSGGTASDILVRGSMFISSGGTATRIKENGGYIKFDSGANVIFESHSFSGISLYSCTTTVHSETTANSLYVGEIAYLHVYGGIVNNTTIDSGGLNVYDHGLINNITVKKGYVNLNYNCTANGTILYSGGMSVLLDSIANNTVLESGGTLNIYDGSASDTIINFGRLVLSGTSDHGGTAQNTTLNQGGSCYVSYGGIANNTTINSGRLFVSHGGRANNTIINSGVLAVFSNGVANSVSVKQGIVNVLSGANVNSITVLSGGSVDVFSSGSVNIATISSGGIITLSNRAIANNTTVSLGGSLCVASNGVANSAIVKYGGNLLVSKGGTATLAFAPFGEGVISSSVGAVITRLSRDASIYYGNQLFGTVSSANTMSKLSVGIGYTALVYEEGRIDDAFVYSNGLLCISSGGIVNNATVNPGGFLYICNGGIANSVVLDSLAELYVSGGTANDITASRNCSLFVVSGGTANNTSLSANKLFVSMGGIVNETLVGISSFLNVGSGGIANNTTVRYRGNLLVSEGGVTTNSLLQYDGLLFISSGAVAYETTIGLDGSLNVDVGGTASNTTIYDWGSLTVFSGGKLTGKMTLENLACVSAYDGAIIDFDLTQTKAESTALINDLSIINGSPLYTLTVKGKLSCGNYKLAYGATGFNRTISVVNDKGTHVGSLVVGGEKQNIDGIDYTLNLDNNGLLSVTVESAVSVAAKSDKDGNGVSDVMFVWTGNNYAHGYWMNGKSDWWSANAAGVSPDWENLGSYDMSGDGKADTVMFGNVEVNGNKGAYIGYYQDGDDANGWVNIGYLDNAQNIAWKNKVGNLTGNANGANSIVWYAPELYALGVWKDGREDWATLSGSFGGKDWTLAGCGDFNGDGKDAVLMMYNGCMFYSADIDGNVASLGSAAWYNCEVRAFGDFAGDGKDDIVLFDKNTGGMYMLLDGNSDNYAVVGQLDPSDWFIAGCGDYNADGTDDLLVRQYSTGMLGYYTSGDTSKWNVLGYGVDMEWTVIA